MLQRNLLYTGVTRGKRLVVGVGQTKALAIAVRNVWGQRRWSKLSEWLHCVAGDSLSPSSKETEQTRTSASSNSAAVIARSSPLTTTAPALRRKKDASTSLTVFRGYCLRSAVLGGARIRAAHAAVRSESG